MLPKKIYQLTSEAWDCNCCLEDALDPPVHLAYVEVAVVTVYRAVERQCIIVVAFVHPDLRLKQLEREVKTVGNLNSAPEL